MENYETLGTIGEGYAKICPAIRARLYLACSVLYQRTALGGQCSALLSPAMNALAWTRRRAPICPAAVRTASYSRPGTRRLARLWPSRSSKNLMRTNKFARLRCARFASSRCAPRRERRAHRRLCQREAVSLFRVHLALPPISPAAHLAQLRYRPCHCLTQPTAGSYPVCRALSGRSAHDRGPLVASQIIPLSVPLRARSIFRLYSN